MKNHTRALLSTLFAALLWSTAGMFVKLILWDPVAIAGGRSLVAALTLLPAVVKIWETKSPDSRPAPQPKGKKSKNRLIQGAMVGAALAYAAFNLCFILSTKLTTSANAIMLQYASPVYVALLSRLLLGEQVTGPDLACMTVAAGGMVLFFLDSLGRGGSASLAGNLFGVGSGLAFAAMVVLLRLQREGSPVLSMFYGNLLTALLSIPAMLTAPAPDPLSLLILAGAGFVMGVSYGIYAAATRSLSALESVLLPIIDPVLNPVWVFLTVGERPGALSVLGGAVVVLAVAGRSLYALARDRRGQPGPQAQ